MCEQLQRERRSDLKVERGEASVNDLIELNAVKERLIKLLIRTGNNKYVEMLGILKDDKVTLLLSSIPEIEEHYKETLLHQLKGGEEAFRSLLGKLQERYSFASITSRLKDVNSLIVKIVTKYLDANVKPNDENTKYLSITADNYYRIITDLIGFRIVIRFPQEWCLIDSFLRGDSRQIEGIIEDNEEKYINDWNDEYKAGVGQKPFLAEKPKWYFLEPDEKSPMFPIRDELEEVIKQQFDTRPTQRGYRSIHYLINAAGQYIELQVRTLAEEAWAECEHETVYKSMLPDGDKKDLLAIYAKLYANLIVPVTYITQRMYEFANTKDSTPSTSNLYSVMASLLYVTGDLIQRAQNYALKAGTSQQKAYFPEYSGRDVAESISGIPTVEFGTPDRLLAKDYLKLIINGD